VALRDRFKKAEQPDISEIVAEEVAKALGNTPYANSGGSVATLPSYGQNSGGDGLLQTPGTPAVPLPRPGTSFGSQLGPAQPFLPAPLDPVEDSGRAIPRKYEYQVAWNLQLSNDKGTPWSVLKALAEQCDVIHRCIEIRTAEVVGLQWAFTVSDAAVVEIMNEQACSHAKAMQIARDTHAEEIDRLTQFWNSPYAHGDRLWSEWITEALWNHFTYDALAVYPRYNLGGDIIGFDVIDGSTIKPLLDNRGDIPAPPSPAYQQILWGFPRGEYQASPHADGEFVASKTSDGPQKDALAYFVRNRRTWSPYGYSTVEECIPAATLYLERQTWMRAEYLEGTMPKTFMRTDSQEFDPIKLASMERVLNDTLAGSTNERHRIKMLPQGFDPIFPPEIDERYKPDYDEWIIKQIGSKFGVMPTQLGIIPHTGLGGKGQQEGEQDQAESMSKRPLENWLAEVINSLSRRFLGSTGAVTFVLRAEETATRELERTKALQAALYSGQKTLNEVQADLGQPLYDMPEADEPFIVAGNAITFLKGLLDVDGAGETIGQTATGQAAADERGTGTVAPEQAEAVDVPVEAKTEPTPEPVIETKAADADTFTPPKAVQEEAQRALKWIEEGHAGDGFTDTGRKRAADLARGAAVSRETIGRIANFLARHEGDAKAEGWSPGDKGYPSPGRVAYAAWGGEPAVSWTDGILNADKHVIAETKAFKAFVAKRKRTGQSWRDFEFKHVSADEAERLNTEARESLTKASRRPLDALSSLYRGMPI